MIWPMAIGFTRIRNLDLVRSLERALRPRSDLSRSTVGHTLKSTATPGKSAVDFHFRSSTEWSRHQNLQLLLCFTRGGENNGLRKGWAVDLDNNAFLKHSVNLKRAS